MEIEETLLPGVVLIKPIVFGDARGFFMETFHTQRYMELAGINLPFVQDNYSRSAKGVLRGLHYQLHNPQGKLVMVSQGQVFDVAVDIRQGSPTFAQWYGCVLSAENHYQLYVPPGFAHGFCVQSETADFMYKCTEVYQPQDEKGILWNDMEIGIHWPITEPALSAKDKQNPTLSNLLTSGQLPKYIGSAK